MTITTNRSTLPEPRAASPDHCSSDVDVIRLGLVGVLSTLAYFVIFLGLRELTGPQVANVAALVITAVANTATNRRLTFGATGRDSLLRHQAGGLIAFGVGLLLTSGSVAAAPYARQPESGLEVAVLVVANALATLVRFLALRQLMHRRPSAAARPQPRVVRSSAPYVVLSF